MQAEELFLVFTCTNEQKVKPTAFTAGFYQKQ